jgi:hypothetical protein
LGEITSEPLITTIIPTYRRPKLLGRAIRSVLKQTYPHFRVCIYDNASGDETASVGETFVKNDPRVQYYCRSENVGACRNFSDAAGRIDTPFFSFLSDDDVLLPNFYNSALAGFEKFPEAMMSATASIQINERGQIFNVPVLNWRPGLYPRAEGMLPMLEHGHPEWTSVLFRREILKELGPPDIELGGPFDLDFQLRAAARFPMVMSLEPGALFVMHGNSASTLGGFEALSTGWYKMSRKIREDKSIPAKVRSEVEQLLTKSAKRLLLRSALGRIAAEDWNNANQAIFYLSSYFQMTGKPFILKLLSRACQRSRFSRHLFVRSVILYRILFAASKPSRSSRHLQARFGSYARYLEL